MKQVRGEPQIQLEVKDRKILDRLMTQTDKAWDFAITHRRLFTEIRKWDDEMGGYKHVDNDTYTMPRSALLRNVRDARKALQKADAILETWQQDIKSA